ncbi:hypothetical protein ACP70R_015359 [Stipagrostis hirtigluma subsp. patula]
MNRRFVNLVAANSESRIYSLHRLDVAKHLFYPSTAEAQAVGNIDEINNGGGGGGGKGSKDKPPRIERLRRLPAPSTHFHQFPMVGNQRWPSWDDRFMLLGPRSSEGRILHVGVDGHALLYDADTCSTSTMPSLARSMVARKQPHIFISIAAAAGPGEEESEGLYVMTGDYRSYSFELLDLSRPRQWQPLPPPPFPDFSLSSHVTSFTVVDGGRTICISFGGIYVDGGNTYCFDTASREWRKAGDWRLPFDDGAEYVLELNTWIGFSPFEPHRLCASDLSAMDAHQAPTLQHVWEELRPPKEERSIVLNKRYPSILPSVVLERRRYWLPLSQYMVNLGSGRFCIARVFLAEQSESLGHQHETMPEGHVAVFTGVEIVRNDDNGEGGLRMVKHKSTHYKFSGYGICEPKWVL